MLSCNKNIYCTHIVYEIVIIYDKKERVGCRYFLGDGTMWAALPAPDGLRDAAAELLSTLTVVEAEVLPPFSLYRRSTAIFTTTTQAHADVDAKPHDEMRLL